MKRLMARLLLAGFLAFCFGGAFAAPPEKRVFDQGGFFSPSVIAELEKRTRDFQLQYQLDLVVLTTKKTFGKTSQEYADDFYDDEGFGIGADKSGLLLLIDLDNRQTYISTSGRAIEIFTDYRINRIIDEQLPKLKSGDYYGAFKTAIEAAAGMIEQDEKGMQASARAVPMSMEKRLIISVLVGLAMGGLATMLVVFRYRKEYLPVGIADQLKCDMILTQRDDLLAGTSVTSRVIRKKDSGPSSGGGFGGSSTHQSSSGRTHGGGGRGF